MVAVPTKLGRYEIVKHLANGGMAQVLIARATGIEGFERHVVVKRIHADHAADPAFVKMFLDEARTSAALHHNNIVQVHDIGKEDGEYFFAMEYVHGQDLRMILKEASRRREKVPWEHVVTIMTSAAAGLHHAHELRGADRKLLGLVHRDVSPANILIGYDGTVKMVDFGIAKAALRTGEGTRGGALKGKVSYMAPEQCAGKQIDRRSDVYALGVVLYELSTVRRLFKGDNDFVTMSAIVAGEIPSPTKVRPDMPAKLAEIILKALAKKPADRFQTADEMREALEELANDLKLRTSNGALASYMKHMFGAQPEPWLVNEEADLELTVDFDGSDSGMAQASANARNGIPDSIESMPSSPIARARRRITSAPPQEVQADGSAPMKKAAGTGAGDHSATPLGAAPAVAVPRTATSSRSAPVVMIPPKDAPHPARTTTKTPTAGIQPIARTQTPPAGVATPPPAIGRTQPPPPAGIAARPQTPPAGIPNFARAQTGPPAGTSTRTATPVGGTPVTATQPATVTPATPSTGAPTRAKAASLAPPASAAPGRPTPVPGATSPVKPPLPEPAKRRTPPPMPAVAAPILTPNAITAKPADLVAAVAKPADDDAKMRLPSMADDDFTPEESDSRDLPVTAKPAEAIVAKPDPVVAKPAPEPVVAKAEPVARPATEPVASKPDKKKLAIIVAAGGLLLILILYFATRGGGDTKEPPKTTVDPPKPIVDPPAKPVVDPPKPVVDPPTPDAAVAIEPDAAEAAGSAGAGSGDAVTDTGSGSAAAGSGSAVKRPKYVPPPPKKKWNPDELFIKP